MQVFKISKSANHAKMINRESLSFRMPQIINILSLGSLEWINIGKDSLKTKTPSWWSENRENYGYSD